MNDEAITLAKQVIKAHKAEKKRKAAEDKKKDDKSKPRLFTFMELTGAVFLFSIPVVLCQLALINYANHWMQTIFNAPH
jgi:hypothetical protein